MIQAEPPKVIAGEPALGFDADRCERQVGRVAGSAWSAGRHRRCSGGRRSGGGRGTHRSRLTSPDDTTGLLLGLALIPSAPISGGPGGTS